MQGAAESDLAEELAQHLEGRYRELLSGGASEAEAYQKAVSKLSDVHPLRAMESGSITPRRIYSPCAWA
jgi:hypothetical protein